MITKSKLAVLTVLALVAVVVGGVWLATDTDGGVSDAATGPIPEARTEPTLTGRGEELRAEAPPPAEAVARAGVPPSVLIGRVVDPRGDPVPGAEVFVLPPGVAGVDAELLADAGIALARTDAEGAFCLEPAPRVGRLVAFAADRLPASLPVEETAPDAPCELVIGDARRITVRVEDPEGRWPVGCAVDLDTDPTRTWERAADPETRSWYGFIEATATPRAAEQTLRIPTRAPVRIRVDPPRGWAAVPRRAVLAADDDRVDFRLVRSGVLRLRVVDHLTGEAPAGEHSVAVYVEDLGTGATAWSLGGRHVDHDLDGRLSPGRYRVDVTVDGYLPASDTFEIRSPGERTDLVVRLEPRHAGNSLGRVLLRVADGERASDALRALARSGAPAEFCEEYVVLLRASGESAWSDAYAEELSDGRVDLRPLLVQTRQSGLRPGTYDLYVARRDAGTAAFLPGVRVFGAQDNEVAVSLRPGTFLRVTDLVDGEERLRDLSVHAAGLGSLPPIHWRPDGYWAITAPSDVAALLRAPLQPHVLGPFPADEIEVRIETADGEQRAVRVRGAPIVR